MKFASIPSPSRHSNHVISLMCDAIQKSGWNLVTVNKFTIWWVIRKGRKIDWIFFHWPQMMFRGSGCIHSSIKYVYFISRIVLLRLFGVKVIWVAHNVLPHESRCLKLEVLFRRIFLKTCNVVIGMSSCCKSSLEATLGSSGKVYIQSLLGHYGNCYDPPSGEGNDLSRYKNVNGEIRFLLFGSYRSNKGLEDFIAEWVQLEIKGVVLLIAGVWPNELAVRFSSKRVQFLNQFIPDCEVAAMIISSDWVVLPYEEYTTSAIYTLGITYNKPVLARDSEYALQEITHGLGVIYQRGKLEQAVLKIQKGGCADEHSLAAENKRRNWKLIADDLVEELQSI